MQYRYYTDTIVEYNMCLMRLKLLVEKREELYTKYLGVKSPNLDKIGTQSSFSGNDKVIAYLNEYEAPKGDKPSLKEQIEKLQYEKQQLEVVIKDMQNQLAKVSGVEGRLFYLIAVEQHQIRKAIEKVADEFYMTEANVWKTYYKNIKEEVRKLRK